MSDPVQAKRKSIREKPPSSCPICHGTGIEDWEYLGLDPCPNPIHQKTTDPEGRTR